jgi:hypothetical protein
MILTENNVDFIKQYCDLLETIEEAFHYVIDSFMNFEKTEGDRVLADIFTAFSMLGQSHVSLNSLLKGQGAFLKEFDEVLVKALQLEGKMDLHEEKQNIIQQLVYPAFIAWKTKAEAILHPYIQN